MIKQIAKSLEAGYLVIVSGTWYFNHKSMRCTYDDEENTCCYDSYLSFKEAAQMVWEYANEIEANIQYI